MSEKAVMMALCRCLKQGLVKRKAGVYEVTQKGIERLRYYESMHA